MNGNVITGLLIISNVTLAYFWWTKTRLKRKIYKLLNTAKLAAHITYSHHLAKKYKEDELFGPIKDRPAIASAAVNFLFGESPNQLHKDLPLEKIHTDALEWIKQEDSIKEMIIQSLSISKQSGATVKENIVVNRDYILDKLSSSAPPVLKLDDYEQLIQKVLNTLSPEEQTKIATRRY